MQLLSGVRPFNLTLLVISLLVVGVPVLWAANQYRLTKRYHDGLSQIKIGDPKQKVIALMGQPDEINGCFVLHSSSPNPGG